MLEVWRMRHFCLLGIALLVSSRYAGRDESDDGHCFDGDLKQQDIVIVKIGGSSITNKAILETLNRVTLEWFAGNVLSSLSTRYTAASLGFNDSHRSRNGVGYVIVHGAGSFGHHTAKTFGLSGQSEPPQNEFCPSDSVPASLKARSQRHLMEGLAKTRLQVQTLNAFIVRELVARGINAVGLSPCIAVPGLQAHGGDKRARTNLVQSVEDSLRSGLVPVLHGDACLYGPRGAGILSGDDLVQIIGSAPWAARAVFLTDVDGVYTEDPRQNASAEFCREIVVDAKSGEVLTVHIHASDSSHAHDVTGGLQRKLAVAVNIVRSGRNVTIARAGSRAAEYALKNERSDKYPSTLLFAI